MAFYRGKRNAWADGAAAAPHKQPLRQPLGSNSPLFDEFDAQNRQSGSIEAELLDLCRSLRHACAAMEARLDRQDHTAAAPLNHRAKPHAAARPSQAQSRNAYQHSDFDDQNDGQNDGQDDGYMPEPSAISMRDMTGFLLSREGEHFLNLVRRMIREEMAQSSAGPEKPELPRRAPRDTLRPDLAQSSLRDILRRESPRRRAGI